jgi:hypothetical protein
MATEQQVVHSVHTTSLAEILERVLDKGIVIAGDIVVHLGDVELLSIKLRLIVASVDRAREIGIDWWESDPKLSSNMAAVQRENADLRARVAALDRG